MTKDEFRKLKVGDRARCIDDLIPEAHGWAIAGDSVLPSFSPHAFKLIKKRPNMTTDELTPADALRRIADNLAHGRPPMCELQVKSPFDDDWRDSHLTALGGEISLNSLINKRVKVRSKPVLTPAEEAGWSVGDIGRIKKNGQLVILKKDNGCTAPYWKLVSNGLTTVQELDRVERLIPASECK